MVLKRRAPGQRRRRSRREDELAQVERAFPEKYQELLELRKYHAQGFRKELAKLIKKAKISKGRTYLLRDEDKELIALDDIGEILRVVEERIASGVLDFRALNGLRQEELMFRARPDLLVALKKLTDELLERNNRHLRHG